MSPRSAPPFAYAVLIIGQLAVGSAAILARSGLAAGMEPVSLAAWRLTVAAGLLLAGSQIRIMSADNDLEAKQLTAHTGRRNAHLAVAGVLLGLHFAFWFASLQMVSVARSTLL